MRYIALLLLIVTPSVFSLPAAPSLPFVSSESGSVLLLLVGLVGVVLIRRRQQ
jgi:hypothetical protein